ncbi:MAG: ABC transporter permease [Chloroflexi bacterium]|nr:ABC transporter permease [Chloroflexota bacterium]
MAVVTSTVGELPRRQSTGALVWKRFRHNRAAMIALGFIVLQVLIALFANLIAPYDPIKGIYLDTYQFPSSKHLLGTDDLGRDVLSRIIFGARISYGIGILSQFILVLIGVPIGALSGLIGGWFDYMVMRLIDVLSSLPMIMFYILLLIALRGGFGNMILTMALTGWIGVARLVRGQVLSLKQTDYVRAARAMGGNTRHIFLTHLVRNSLTPVIVSMALGVPGAMFAEAGLSFLGLGIAPPEPSWGQMIGIYQTYIQSFWHLSVFPAIVLALTMFAWIALGEGLQKALDPSMRS